MFAQLKFQTEMVNDNSVKIEKLFSDACIWESNTCFGLLALINNTEVFYYQICIDVIFAVNCMFPEWRLYLQ
jgi:hypothetical protein